jgi:hypothetical protein
VTLPPIIAGARIIESAIIDERVTLTGRTVRFLGGRPPGTAPRLAIGIDLTGGKTRLMHCDDEWNTLSASDHDSIEAAKQSAEEVYSGVLANWQPASFSDSEVAAFLQAEDEGLICSFCGRHPHEYLKLVTGHGGAAICDRCITAFKQGQTSSHRPS